MKIQKLNFDEMLAKFKQDNPKYSRTPSSEYSSGRMGGWLLKDANNKYIGFASYLSGYQLVDIVETDSKNVKKIKGYSENEVAK
jgi:hypothetical protein